MDIYIKPFKKISVVQRNKVYIKDLAQVVATADVTQKITDIVILEPTVARKTNYLVSVTDIIQKIQSACPEHTVNNVGEMDTLVEFLPKKTKDNPLWKWLKIFFVIIILLTGSSTAIMSFHNDAQIPKIFQNYHKIVFNEENDKPLIFYIPYSVGLAVGIITFFNHFAGKKITSDPTPIEVEMSRYEAEVTNTQIKALMGKRDADD